MKEGVVAHAQVSKLFFLEGNQSGGAQTKSGVEG